jgi:hypothetical protein
MRIAFWMILATMVAACSSSKQAPDAEIPTDASAGTVTFHLVVPGTESFCDQLDSCSDSLSHLRIRTNTGQALTLPPSPDCTASCSNVCQNNCSLIYCQKRGVAVTTGDQPWDGRNVIPSTCGADCLVPTFAPAGPYTAQLCATPGALTTADGGQPACTATGPEACGPIVAFTFPSATPIDLSLTANGG